MKFILISTIVSIFLFSCQGNSGKMQGEADPGNQKVKVVDVVQTSAYTYLYVSDNRSEYWIAVTSKDAREGDVYYFAEALEMDNFYSKELDWNFEKIWFVSEISKTPIPLRKHDGEMGDAKLHHREKAASNTKLDVNIPPREGSITIAELYANREKYNNQMVKLAGEVTRFNPGIMNRNWVHIQDGSDDNGNFDITVTTADFVRVGDQVFVEGRLALDRDFGAGYFYSLIVESAKVISLVEH